MFISRAAVSVRQSLKFSRTGLNLLLMVVALVLLGEQTNAHAATINVPAGASLQAAINAAQPGDEIVLEAGANYTGPITLPVKSGSSYITIRSSAIANLPPEGTRVTPAYASAMPKIISMGAGDPALQTQPGAHHFRFVGIEFKRGHQLLHLGRQGQGAGHAGDLRLERAGAFHNRQQLPGSCG
ncbi:MAG: hypothetical protein LC731_05600 [Acidobacteria bacterium]|nr:hypothetical protein [Acidobacteriota bacterium]